MEPVHSITRYRPDPAGLGEFEAAAAAALACLARQPGFEGGALTRNLDEPDLYALTTHWAGVGAYRRAMSQPEVKITVHPLLYRCLDEPSAYAPVLSVQAGGSVLQHDTDLPRGGMPEGE